MVRKLSISDILGLSPAERILLVEEIWDSLATTPEAVPMTDAQRRELDSRLDAHTRDPQAGSDWESAKERIAKRS